MGFDTASYLLRLRPLPEAQLPAREDPGLYRAVLMPIRPESATPLELDETADGVEPGELSDEPLVPGPGTVLELPGWIIDPQFPFADASDEDWINEREERWLFNSVLFDATIRNAEEDSVEEEKQRITREVCHDPTFPLLLDTLYRTPDPLKPLMEERAAWFVAATSGFVFHCRLLDDAPSPGKVIQLPKGGLKVQIDAEPRDVALIVDRDDSLTVNNRHRPPDIVSVGEAQFAHGFIFDMAVESPNLWFDLLPHDGQPGAERQRDWAELRTVLRRWVGPARSGRPEFVREAVLKEPDVVASEHEPDYASGIPVLDPLEPRQLVGQQLHYAVEVQNRHGRMTHCANLSAFRERLDPPPSVQDVEARLIIENAIFKKIVVSGRVADLEWEDPDLLQMRVFLEHRPLDPCGFYGDPDDQALLEGLRALDLSWDQSAPPPADDAAAEPGSDEQRMHDEQDRLARQDLLGRYSTEGLIPLKLNGDGDLRLNLSSCLKAAEEFESAPAEAGAPRSIRLELPVAKSGGLKLPPNGTRLHVCLERKRVATPPAGVSAPSSVQSAVSACRHAIELPPADAGTDTEHQTQLLPVFQFENFDPKLRPERTYLKPAVFGLEEAVPLGLPEAKSRELPPTQVRIRLRHPLVSDLKNSVEAGAGFPLTAPLGGYRLWYRDIVALGDPSPFRHVQWLQVLPPLLASYRPVSIDGSGPWELEAPPGGQSPQRKFTENPENHVYNLIGALHQPGNKDHSRPLWTPANQVPTELNTGETPIGRWHEEVSKVLARTFKAPDQANNGEQTVSEQGNGQADNSAALPREKGALLGRLLAAFREVYLATDVVLRVDEVQALIDLAQRGMPGAEDHLAEVIRNNVAGAGDRLGSVKIFLPTDASGHPFARITIAAAPTVKWLKDRLAPVKETVDAKLLHRLLSEYEQYMAGALVQRVRSHEHVPRTLAFDRERQVRYRWRGISDLWHHELEWAVECLDRYHHIREVIATRGDAAAASADSDLLSPAELRLDVRRGLSVLRRSPITQRVGVIPVATEGQAHIAFRLLDTPERRAASENAMNRTRFGYLQVQTGFRRNLLHLQLYRDSFKVVEREWLEDIKEAIQELKHSDKTDLKGKIFRRETLSHELMGQWSDLRAEFGSDLLEFGHEPHYFEIELSAWCVADGRNGPSSQATQVRPARALGMLCLPEYDIDVDGDQFELKIRLVTTPLHSCLSHDEEKLVEDSEAHPLLGDFLTAEDNATTAAKTKVHLLPDLALEYVFSIDIGTDEGDPRLVPLLAWRGPVAHGIPNNAQDPHDANATPLGFRGFARAPWLADFATVGSEGHKIKVSSRFDKALMTLEVRASAIEAQAGLVPENIRLRFEKATPADQKGLVYLQLRRGNRVTRPIRLPRG